eukprot:TRINITY_DN1725_c0_g1_i1.p1 TRINITY_DN1725_c0_g1~~TRINITY_DN1725_c0_g1_i1.p1  ORF type:complete len:409 (+),score=82.92 TRINITY_DN1725_c0_g1_i1:292-1518(+)
MDEMRVVVRDTELSLEDVVLANMWYEWQALLLPLYGAPGLPLGDPPSFVPPRNQTANNTAYRGAGDGGGTGIHTMDDVPALLGSTLVMKLHRRKSPSEVADASAFGTVHVDDWPGDDVFPGFGVLRNSTTMLLIPRDQLHMASWLGFSGGTVVWGEQVAIVVNTRVTHDFTLDKVISNVRTGHLSPPFAARIAAHCYNVACVLALLREAPLTAPAFFTVISEQTVHVLVRDPRALVGEREMSMDATDADEFLHVGGCDWWREPCVVWDSRALAVPDSIEETMVDMGTPLTYEAAPAYAWGPRSIPFRTPSTFRVTYVSLNPSNAEVIETSCAFTGTHYTACRAECDSDETCDERAGACKKSPPAYLRELRGPARDKAQAKADAAAYDPQVEQQQWTKKYVEVQLPSRL